MKSLSLIPLASAALFSCYSPPELPVEALATNILNGYIPKMVGPGTVSQHYFEGHASVMPDNAETYFAVYSNDHTYSIIAFSKRASDGRWQSPEIAPFSGEYSDGSPALSPDGKRLFFSSRRPHSGSSSINESNDLWYVERDENGNWGEPKWLGPEINSVENDFSPSVDMRGNLYFCSNRSNGFGDMDVYFSPRKANGDWSKPVLLGPSVNSQYHEGNVGVSPDGNLLFVMVQNKPGDFGYDDIHYTFKTKGRWQPLKNLGVIVNTETYDFSPKVAPDGKTLYFSSRINRDYHNASLSFTFHSFAESLNSPLNGLGNIYTIEIEKLELTYE